jgi:hypothetical protein
MNMDGTEKKVTILVCVMVILIYVSLWYTGNFNFGTFAQGFGENLAAFIVVALLTWLLLRKRRKSK